MNETSKEKDRAEGQNKAKSIQTTLEGKPVITSNEIMVEEIKRGNRRIAKFAGLEFPYLLPPKHYLDLLGWELIPRPLETNFVGNIDEPIHRWFGYVQGFSASFVRKLFQIMGNKPGDRIFDPFMGSGTVAVESMFSGMNSIGAEINPYLYFASILKTKAITKIKLKDLQKDFKLLKTQLEDKQIMTTESDIFLKMTKRHFDTDTLQFLTQLRETIRSIDTRPLTKDLMKLAFLSILIDASRMTRAPCLGYPKKGKDVGIERTKALFEDRLQTILQDFYSLQNVVPKFRSLDIDLFLEDARTCEYNGLKADAVITSPPYVNGMDYVNNYKIELAWGDFASSYEDLRALKNAMVVCDNISRKTVKDTVLAYQDSILEDILERIEKSIEGRPKAYRRVDQPKIVAQYFNDLYDILQNTAEHIKPGGYIALVVGDSLIADVYVPTDFLLAKLCVEHLGFKLNKIFKSRDRRSGQRTTFKLRETVTILEKK